MRKDEQEKTKFFKKSKKKNVNLKKYKAEAHRSIYYLINMNLFMILHFFLYFFPMEL